MNHIGASILGVAFVEAFLILILSLRFFGERDFFEKDESVIKLLKVAQKVAPRFSDSRTVNFMVLAYLEL